MYNTEDEQEPTVKQPQKASKIPRFVDIGLGTEDEQEHQKSSDPSPAKIPNFAAASCTYILTKGIRKGEQCRFRTSDETGKFFHHHKQPNPF